VSFFGKNWIEWYGIYWAIIEDLYNNANALQMDCEWIAYDLRTSEEKVTQAVYEKYRSLIDDLMYEIYFKMKDGLTNKAFIKVK